MAELTSQWLGSVLGYEVNSFTAQPLGEGVGVLGLVARIKLDADEGPDTLIIKFPSKSADNRAVANTYNMYGREIAFYTTVAPTVPIRAPICYHAQFDPDSCEFVLLLEDLLGYRIGDQVAGCTASEAHLVIESLAALHRNTWNVHLAADGLDDIPRHDMPYQRQGMTAGYQVGWPQVLAQFPHLFTERTKALGALMPGRVNDLLDQIYQEPLVIAHGDVRLDNIFFADDGIALVDFQAVCLASPEHDLAYFVTQSLPDEVRRSEDWVAVYHRHLTSEGLDYSLEDTRRRYALNALYFCVMQ